MLTSNMGDNPDISRSARWFHIGPQQATRKIKPTNSWSSKSRGDYFEQYWMKYGDVEIEEAVSISSILWRMIVKTVNGSSKYFTKTWMPVATLSGVLDEAPGWRLMGELSWPTATVDILSMPINWTKRIDADLHQEMSFLEASGKWIK